MTETLLTLSPIDAMDAALGGSKVEVIDQEGSEWLLLVDSWLTLGDDDRELFVKNCTGMTIDVGCGPGRLTHGLSADGIDAFGIDVSAEAIRRTRIRGATAQRRDIFGPLPSAGLWDHALLADGNIGIGGDPARLLRRIGQIISATGTILVEVQPPGVGLVCEEYRFRLNGAESQPFAWARVGSDAIAEVAATAGLEVQSVLESASRHVAVLTPSL